MRSYTIYYNSRVLSYDIFIIVFFDSPYYYYISLNSYFAFLLRYMLLYASKNRRDVLLFSRAVHLRLVYDFNRLRIVKNRPFDFNSI